MNHIQITVGEFKKPLINKDKKCFALYPHSTFSLTQNQTQNSPTSQNPHNPFQNIDTPFELKQLHAHLIKTNTPLSTLPLTKLALLTTLTLDFPYA